MGARGTVAPLRISWCQAGEEALQPRVPGGYRLLQALQPWVELGPKLRRSLGHVEPAIRLLEPVEIRERRVQRLPVRAEGILRAPPVEDGAPGAREKSSCQKAILKRS